MIKARRIKEFLILYAVITAISVYLTRGDWEDRILPYYLHLIAVLMPIDWIIFTDPATYTGESKNAWWGIVLFLFIKSIFVCVIWLFLRFLFRRIRRLFGAVSPVEITIKVGDHNKDHNK